MRDPDPTIPEPGQILDRRYRVRRLIARGGMAVILEAEQIHLGRRVALKTIDASSVDAGVLRERLMREARALELSRCPSVVDVLDAGLDGTLPFVALEMLDGRSLDAILATRGKLSLASAVELTRGLCDALAAVHQAGVVHRDVKPSNVFVSASRAGGERVALIDFGVAFVPTQGDASAKLTRMGDRVGTLDYMAPEQLLGEAVDGRADLFAAALVFHECVTGALPTDGSSRALARASLVGAPIPSLAAAVGGPCPALDAWLTRALARDPARRHESASAMADELGAAAGTFGSAPGLLRAAPPRDADVGRPQRFFARAPYVAPIRVVDAEGTVRDGQTADLSEGGLLAMLAAPLATGAHVTLRVGLPVSGRVVSLSGVVRWTREARHRYVVGLEFAAPPADASADIQRFVALTMAPPPSVAPMLGEAR